MRLVDAKGLIKNYQINFDEYIRAINGIDIEIENGEFVCIMGPSGSGKSTLLNLLTTIDLPTSGKIYIDEQNVRVLGENKLCHFRYEYLGYIFQDLNLLDNYTVYDNIALPLIMGKEKKKFIKEEVKRISKQLGIQKLLDKKVLNCSGGEQQRVAIARALITKPRLLVADEPTGNLDSKNTDEVLSLFKNIYQDGNTILMVTHDCFVASHASRVVYLKDGKLENEIKREGLSYEAFFNKIVEMNANELGDNAFENSDFYVLDSNDVKVIHHKKDERNTIDTYFLRLGNEINEDLNLSMLNEIGSYEITGSKTISINTMLEGSELKKFIAKNMGILEKDFMLINKNAPKHRI